MSPPLVVEVADLALIWHLCTVYRTEAVEDMLLMSTCLSPLSLIRDLENNNEISDSTMIQVPDLLCQTTMTEIILALLHITETK